MKTPKQPRILSISFGDRDETACGWGGPNREAVTNEYGQMLAAINGVLYPTDAELTLVGGTVPR